MSYTKPDVSSLLSFDLETHLIQPGLLAPPIVCCSWAAEGREPELLHLQFDEFWHDLKSLLSRSVTWVGANIAYDFGCILAARPDLMALIWRAYREGRVFDVQIAASLTAIAEGRMRDGELYRKDGTRIMSGRFSLDECVKEWLGRSDAKANDFWRLRYALLEDVPVENWPPDARQYPIDDAVNTLEVAKAQLAGAKNLQDMPVQSWAAFCIHLGAVWGLRTEAEYVAPLAGNIDAHIKELEVFAVENGLMRPKSKKPGAELAKDTKAIGELVMKAYDGAPPTTETGKVSISRETLADSGDPVLEKFVEVGKWQKLQTYIPTLQQGTTAPINVKPNVLLSTGRVSYEGLIQLMPRSGGIREAFVPRAGHVMSSVDYAAIEMSTLAQVCLWTVGWSELAEAINRGVDPHGSLGADLLGITYESFMTRLKAGDKSIKGIRQAGKAGNFGYPGMMGAAKFVIAQKRAGASVCEWFFADGKCGKKGAGIIHEYKDNPLEMPLCKRCVEQSEVIRSGYLKRWKEVPKYWDWVMKTLRRDDAVVQFISGRIRGAPHGPAAANTLFQGLAADGAKRAVIGLTEEMYLKPGPLLGSRLLVFAHDETILEIPEERMHEAALRQAEVMVTKMKEVVPDVAVKAEPALMRRWYKAAETVYENGRLIPWEPKKETI